MNDTRISKDDYYLEVAEVILKRSTCLRRHYGAVIVNNDIIIATGYNGSPRKKVNCDKVGVCKREVMKIAKGERYELCEAVHAEQNALINTSRQAMLGGIMYIVGKEVSTGEYANPKPCAICEKMILNSGLSKVIGRMPDGSIKELMSMED